MWGFGFAAAPPPAHEVVRAPLPAKASQLHNSLHSSAHCLALPSLSRSGEKAAITREVHGEAQASCNSWAACIEGQSRLEAALPGRTSVRGVIAQPPSSETHHQLACKVPFWESQACTL